MPSAVKGIERARSARFTRINGIVQNINLRGYATNSIPPIAIGATLESNTYSAAATGTIDLPIYLTGNLDQATSQIVGLKTLTITLNMNTDLLTPISATAEIAGMSQIPVNINGKIVTMQVTLPANFAFTDSTLLLTLHCQAFVTASIETSITLSSNFTPQNICYTQPTSSASSAFTLLASCQDSVLTSALAKQLNFSIHSIIPNPTTGSLEIGISYPNPGVGYQVSGESNMS